MVLGIAGKWKEWFGVIARRSWAERVKRKIDDVDKGPSTRQAARASTPLSIIISKGLARATLGLRPQTVQSSLHPGPFEKSPTNAKGFETWKQ